MPKYRIQSPDGRTFEVNAPEGASRDDILSKVQTHAEENPPSAPISTSESSQNFFTDLANPNPDTWYGTLLPLAREKDGSRRLGAPLVLQDTVRAITAPGRALKGEIPYDMDALAREARGTAAVAVGGPMAPALARSTAKVAQEVAGSPVMADVVKSAKDFVGRAAYTIQTKAPQMTREQIQEMARAGYRQAENAGVIISRKSMEDFVNSLENGPNKLKGYDPDVTPKTARILQAIRKKAEAGPVTLESLEGLRSVATGARMTKDLNEGRLAGDIVTKMDDFVEGLDATGLSAGDVQEAIPALTNARRLWKVNAKLREIEEIIDTAEDLGDPRHIRNKFRALIRNRRKFNRFNEAEKKIISRIARTGTLEGLGKLAPSMDALGAVSAAGYVIGGAINPLTLALPAAGMTAKRLSTNLKASDMASLQDEIASSVRGTGNGSFR